ncbi:serine hydrolase [uncultured Croceitalea sp.]|uniref:serine hydrolase n=1 Tax=uncultured Croceitalea sp. TaxID=1798908 RepID=UPI003305B145
MIVPISIIQKNIIIITLLFTATVVSQNQRFDTFIKDSLDNYIESSILKWEIPGLAIGIVKEGQIIFNKGYGIKQINKSDTVNRNTLFNIGSLTKAITCASVVIESQKNNFALSDPINKWLPNFHFKNSIASSNVIIEDILTGRTGLGSHQGDFLFWKTQLNKNNIINIFHHIETEIVPRRKFIYNNTSYILLDDILLNATGKDWKGTIKSNFFFPLKMNDSYTSSNEIPIEKKNCLAYPHLKHTKKIIRLSHEDIQNMGPAGSIVSSSTDMCKWMMEFINMDGVFGSSTKKTIRRPYQLRGYRTHKENTNQLRFLFSGMGWNIFEEYNHLTYVHDGGTDGYKSYLMIIPESKYGVIVLTNSRSHNFAEALVEELHYAIMNQPFQNISNEYLKTYRAKEREELNNETKLNKLKHTKTAYSIEDYTGTYHNLLYGNMKIELSNNYLKLRLLQHQNTLSAQMSYLGNDSFLLSFSSPEFSSTRIDFSRKNNQVEGFTFFAEASGDINYEFLKVKSL